MQLELVHGDLKLENVLFSQGKLSAVLDFDDYRYSYLLEDAVMVIMHNLHDPSTNCLRSGRYDLFIDSIKNHDLLHEIHTSIKHLLKARLLYDVCKYAIDGRNDLVSQLFNDGHVRNHILS